MDAPVEGRAAQYRFYPIARRTSTLAGYFDSFGVVQGLLLFAEMLQAAG